MVERPDTIVQEDNATPHSKHGQELYDEYRKKIEWPANSPDLNVIKPCWMWIKVKTTKQGPISSKAKLTES
jgi:hypothetical protein